MNQISDSLGIPQESQNLTLGITPAGEKLAKSSMALPATARLGKIPLLTLVSLFHPENQLYRPAALALLAVLVFHLVPAIIFCDSAASYGSLTELFLEYPLYLLAFAVPTLLAAFLTVVINCPARIGELTNHRKLTAIFMVAVVLSVWLPAIGAYEFGDRDASSPNSMLRFAISATASALCLCDIVTIARAKP